MKNDLEKLRAYIKSLSAKEKLDFAEKCGTTLGYLRNACNSGKRPDVGFAIRIEQASDGNVRCEDLRPDIDWAYLRGTGEAA